MPGSERPVVVVADPIAPAAIERLKQGPCRVIDASSDPEALNAAISEAWGLIVRSRTKVTAELIGKAPKLSFIARAGVGVDSIDMRSANARGIRVVNAPTAATTSVAELTVALMLVLLRGLYPRITETKSGAWNRSELGLELQGKTVGFVGYGRIAREVARRLVPFGSVPLAYDPFVKEPVDATALRPLDEVLSRADIVSLHAALTPENRHLIDANRLAGMKRGAFVVNVARGPLIDERALLRAIDSGQIGGAALDVFESEPPTLRALLEHPKVLPTPHLGAATREGQARAGLGAVEETLRALTGQPLHALVSGAGGPA